jgi:hypothetical protein
MTPERAAVGLLNLGPLSHYEFALYTGWDPEKVRTVTNRLIASGAIALHTDTGGPRYWVGWRLRAKLREINAVPERGRPSLRRVA